MTAALSRKASVNCTAATRTLFHLILIANSNLRTSHVNWAYRRCHTRPASECQHALSPTKISRNCKWYDPARIQRQKTRPNLKKNFISLNARDLENNLDLFSPAFCSGPPHGSAGVGMFFPTCGSEKSLWLPGRVSNKPPASAGATVPTPDRFAILQYCRPSIKWSSASVILQLHL